MATVRKVNELDELLKHMRTPFLEVWAELEDEQSICALVNNEKNLGWLMYLRTPDDAGFSSRNPDYVGPPSTVIQYRLENGQMDEYPAFWALQGDKIFQALRDFLLHQRPPSWVVWHNDSGDGATLN